MPDIFGKKSGTLLPSLTASSNDTLEASELMKLGDCLVSSWSITKPFFHYAMKEAYYYYIIFCWLSYYFLLAMMKMENCRTVDVYSSTTLCTLNF